MRSTLVMKENVGHRKSSRGRKPVFTYFAVIGYSLLWICLHLNPYLESASNKMHVSTISIMHSGSLREAGVHCTES